MSNYVLEQTMEYAQTQPAEKPETPKEQKKKAKAVDKEQKRERQKKRKEARKKNRIPRKRLFPIPLRIIIVLLLAGLALIIGLMIGYGVFGGENPTEVLEIETWQHIVDLVITEK